MSERNMEELIGTLYDLVQDARTLPLGADKCILERDKVLDMLDEIIAQLPGEIKQAKTIVESRNELIGQARREAEAIIRQAKEDAKALVAQEAIVQEAQAVCQDLYTKNKSRIAELRKVCNNYMDDSLRQTEDAIAQSLAEVRDTRARFHALVASQEAQAGTEAE